MLRIVLAAIVVIAGVNTCFAQADIDELEAKWETKLATYDPVAVEAANSYAKNFDMSKQMKLIAQSMAPGVVANIKRKNPSATEEDIKIFWEEFSRVALVDSAPLFEKWTVMNILDVFTTEEIVAVNDFYSSDVGKRVMSKLPQLMASMPEMLGLLEKYTMPAANAAAKAKLKAMGKDIKT